MKKFIKSTFTRLLKEKDFDRESKLFSPAYQYIDNKYVERGAPFLYAPIFTTFFNICSRATELLLLNQDDQVSWDDNTEQVQWLNTLTQNFLRFAKGDFEFTFLRFFDSFLLENMVKDSDLSPAILTDVALKTNRSYYLLSAVMDGYIKNKDFNGITDEVFINQIGNMLAESPVVMKEQVDKLFSKLDKLRVDFRDAIILKVDNITEYFERFNRNIKEVLDTVQRRISPATLVLLRHSPFTGKLDSFLINFLEHIVKQLPNPLLFFQDVFPVNSDIILEKNVFDRNDAISIRLLVRMIGFDNVTWLLEKVVRDQLDDNIPLRAFIACGVIDLIALTRAQNPDDFKKNYNFHNFEKLSDDFVTLLRTLGSNNIEWINLLENVPGVSQSSIITSWFLQVKFPGHAPSVTGSSTIKSFIKKHPYISGGVLFGGISFLTWLIMMKYKKLGWLPTSWKFAWPLFKK